MITLTTIFDTLWKGYTSQNPSVKKIYDLFVNEGETVENDHIAFRTFDDPRINIDVLAKPFIEAGYRFVNDYHFEKKHLYAKHFELANAPRVFISQLKTKDFSNYLQQQVHLLIQKISVEVLQSDNIVNSGNIWGSVSYEVYEKLRSESEYAAWLIANGFRANHFTVSINALKKFDTVEKVNQFIKENGFKLNDAGGEIKGTPAELLEQSSTRAEMISMNFLEGIKEIPGCYYEFARRYPDNDGKLYSGFIAKSADKIFESTDKIGK